MQFLTFEVHQQLTAFCSISIQHSVINAWVDPKDKFKIDKDWTSLNRYIQMITIAK